MYWRKERGILKSDLPSKLGAQARYEVSQFSMFKDSKEPFKAYAIIGGVNKSIGKRDTEKQAKELCLKHLQSLIRALQKTEERII